MRNKHPYKFLVQCALLVMASISFSRCTDSGKIALGEIHVGLHNNNELKIQMDVTTDKAADIYAEYWKERDSSKKWSSPVATHTSNGRLVICNVAPETDYGYRIIAKNK